MRRMRSFRTRRGISCSTFTQNLSASYGCILLICFGRKIGNEYRFHTFGNYERKPDTKKKFSKFFPFKMPRPPFLLFQMHKLRQMHLRHFFRHPNSVKSPLGIRKDRIDFFQRPPSRLGVEKVDDRNEGCACDCVDDAGRKG